MGSTVLNLGMHDCTATKRNTDGIISSIYIPTDSYVSYFAPFMHLKVVTGW